MATKPNQYFPESVSHPGGTVYAKLEELHMTPEQFAIRTGLPKRTILDILDGKSAVTSELALAFEDVLNIPAHFWLNRQRMFEEAMNGSKE